MLNFSITPHDHCRRLESFLRALLPSASFAYPRKLIKNGAVKLNNADATPDSLLFINDQVTVKESSALTALLSDAALNLDILYEDDSIVIVNKPSGLAMHRTAELETNLVERGMEFMAWRKTTCKLYPVNRLDRGTSGAVIMAKSSSAAGMFGRQVKETGLDKLYLALVAGRPDGSGVINAALDGKESETRYRILTEGSGCSLLEVIPLSGRMHQIRRHLEMIGHPVLGDRRYGGDEIGELAGFALHSFKTALIMPNGERLVVCAPLSGELLTLCERGGIRTDSLLAALGLIAEEHNKGETE
ncbi:MAG: RluA family pseudouridine synthase [Desulfuromonadales bacterium]|nr:RluA family pseudouridine synthase [Desulfuromonadales bacterium]